MFSSVHKWNDTRVFHKEAVSLAKGYFIELHAPADFKYKFKSGVHIHGLPQWTNRKTRIRTLFILTKRILRSDADIFHFHDLELIPLGFLLKCMNKIVIYDIHESNSNYILIKHWIPKILRKIISKIVLVIENLAAKHMDAIIVTSTGDFNSFSNSKRKVIIYNFPLTQYFDTKRLNVSKKYDFIYHGSVTKYNFTVLLNCIKELISEIPQIKCCLIIGVIDSELMKYMNLKLSVDNLEKNFELFTCLDYKEIPQKIMESRIGVIPLPKTLKFMNNIPTKLFEFMHCAIPVIASDLPPVRYFFDPKVPWGILVDPLKPNEFVFAIKRLLSDSGLAKRLAVNGFIQGKKLYSWTIEEKKLYALYNEIFKKEYSN